MPLTTDRNDPALNDVQPNGQQKAYLVLSDEERAKGFVRPVRRTYVHVGRKLIGTVRPLTTEQKERYAKEDYAAYEEYPPGQPGSVVGRFLSTREAISIKNGRAGGCGVATTMGQALAETYARNPKFYGATFCCGCGKHYLVEEFEWEDGEVVGS